MTARLAVASGQGPRLLALALTACLAISFDGGAAWAGPPAPPAKGSPQQKEAEALFTQGIALSDEQKWAEALEAFRRSDELRPSLSARFNMAAAQRSMGRYVESKRTLEGILRDGPTWTPPMKAALRGDAEALLAEVGPKVVIVSLRVSPASAAVSVDGSPATRTADGKLELDPGKHVFVVRADGHETTTVARTLSASDKEVSLTAPAVKLLAPPPPPDGGVATKWWFWTITGVVVLGAAGGVTAGVLLSQPASTNAPSATVGRTIPVGFQGWQYSVGGSF